MSDSPDFHWPVRSSRLIRVGGILIGWALASAAHAQALEEPLAAADSQAPRNTGFSIRLDLEPAYRAGVAPGVVSDVYSSAFRQRALDEREAWKFRFGVDVIEPGMLRPTLLHQSPVSGSSQFNFVQELSWPGGLSLTGLQFERRNVLFYGDRVNIRSTSDVQALARGVGLLGAGAGTDLMSLLGWRSHSQLEWQLGEPTRELQWRLTARLDRRASDQSSAVNLQVLRRF